MTDRECDVKLERQAYNRDVEEQLHDRARRQSYDSAILNDSLGLESCTIIHDTEVRLSSAVLYYASYYLCLVVSLRTDVIKHFCCNMHFPYLFLTSQLSCYKLDYIPVIMLRQRNLIYT